MELLEASVNVNNSDPTVALEAAIVCTNTEDIYSSGFRNGLRYALYILTGKEPEFEEAKEEHWHIDTTHLPEDGSLVDFVMDEEPWPGGKIAMTCGVVRNGRIIAADRKDVDITEYVLKWHQVPGVVVKDGHTYWGDSVRRS